MRHSETDTERRGVHAQAHISVCPNQEMHLRIGNVCLHLCKHDFRELAKAVMNAVATADDSERSAILGALH